jgi:hypothetical protein
LWGNKQKREENGVFFWWWPEQRLPHTMQPTCSNCFSSESNTRVSFETRSINHIGSALATSLSHRSFKPTREQRLCN